MYSIPDTGGAWSPEGSAGNLDQYYEAYAFFNPASRRLAVFAGYGFGAWQDLLWEWDGAGSQWVNTPQSSPRPAPRFGHGPSTVAVDEGGKRAFLGQRSLGAASGGYDDLWSLDLRTNTWRNLIAPDSGANARLGSALAYASRTRLLYRFGGCSPIGGAGVCSTMTNELRSARPGSASPAWTRIRNTGSPPSPRTQAFWPSLSRRFCSVCSRRSWARRSHKRRSRSASSLLHCACLRQQALAAQAYRHVLKT